ncbi:helix-turn-helix domain-containing protein [Puia sp.]|uniref:helix-turn-helix domain-containing protein n=1 Tax=Puia sp. TaxID=2045100 RepID=UPI002F42246F
MPFYKVYHPPAILGTLIRELQIYRANWNVEGDLPPRFISCLANTEQNLYFYINDPTTLITPTRMELPVPPVIVTGPKYKTAGLLFGKDHLMLKVAFHPTGIYRLLGNNMRLIVNTGLDATKFWGNEVVEILHRLRQAADYDSMARIAEAFLEKQVIHSCRPEEALDKVAISMLDPQNTRPLEEWAAMACLSRRQFERNFTTRVGISPKLFVRIVRFEWAMKIKNRYPDRSWVDIAAECDYTDSSHILREFKEFAEFPPSRFYLQPTSGYSEFPTG